MKSMKGSGSQNHGSRIGRKRFRFKATHGQGTGNNPLQIDLDYDPAPKHDGSGKPQKDTLKIKIERPPFAHEAPHLAASGGKQKAFDYPNEAKQCQAECPHDSNRSVEVTVPVGMFEAPTQAEANDMAMQFGQYLAESMLDCSAVVEFKLPANPPNVTAEIWVNGPDGSHGPIILSQGTPNGIISLETGVDYDWSATFNAGPGTTVPSNKSGNFKASEGYSKEVSTS